MSRLFIPLLAFLYHTDSLLHCNNCFSSRTPLCECWWNLILIKQGRVSQNLGLLIILNDCNFKLVYKFLRYTVTGLNLTIEISHTLIEGFNSCSAHRSGNIQNEYAKTLHLLVNSRFSGKSIFRFIVFNLYHKHIKPFNLKDLP